MSPTETQAFFERYRDAFDRLDGDAVAGLWHTPSMIAQDAPGAGHSAVTCWADEAPMRANMHALCALYRDASYAKAEFAITEHAELGPNQAFANLQWRLLRADGTLLQAFRTGYQLVRGTAGPQVSMAVAYEEVRLAATAPSGPPAAR